MNLKLAWVGVEGCSISGELCTLMPVNSWCLVGVESVFVFANL